MKPNAKFIDIYKVAAESISDSGVMCLREPSEEEKAQQNEKVSIEVTKKQRPLKEVIEEVCDEYPELKTVNKKQIADAMIAIINEKGQMVEDEIKARTRKMISAFL